MYNQGSVQDFHLYIIGIFIVRGNGNFNIEIDLPHWFYAKLKKVIIVSKKTSILNEIGKPTFI